MNFGYLASTVKQRATNEIKKLSKVKEGERFSKAQMRTGEILSAEWRLRKAGELEMKSGYEFKKLQSFINFQGASDLYTKRAIVFQKNYLDVLSRYENFDSYDILQEILAKIKNPNQFYAVFKNTEQSELDIDLTLQSDQVLSQAMFNAFVERLANSAHIQIDLSEYDVQEEVINL